MDSAALENLYLDIQTRHGLRAHMRLLEIRADREAEGQPPSSTRVYVTTTLPSPSAATVPSAGRGAS